MPEMIVGSNGTYPFHRPYPYFVTQSLNFEEFERDVLYAVSPFNQPMLARDLEQARDMIGKFNF